MEEDEYEPELLTLRTVALREEDRLDVTAALGSSALIAAHRLSAQDRTRLQVIVVRQNEDALRVVDDLSAWAPDARVRLLPAHEVTPYDGTRQDRAVTLTRAAALAKLASGELDVLVTTARGRVQKCPPTGLLTGATRRLRVGDRLDFEELSRGLEQCGYQRVPLVEDPGTFTARGDIVDLWPAGHDSPTRVTVDFDEIKELRPYDPETQVRKPTPEEGGTELFVPPAREAILTSENAPKVRAVMQSLCDDVSYPSSKAQALIEEVATGHLFLGGAAYLPALDELQALASLLPESAQLLFEDPAHILEEVFLQLDRADEGHRAHTDTPHFPPESHYVEGRELDDTLTSHSCTCLHGAAILGAEKEGFRSLADPLEGAVRADLDSLDPLRTELQAAQKVDSTPLALLSRRLLEFEESGLQLILSTRTHTARERLESLLSHREIKTSAEALELESLGTGGIHLVVSSLSRGIFNRAEGYVTLTEEDIFGKRRRRAKKAAAAIKDALDDLRSLTPGDYVVHIEHGIGRYLGLVHQSVGDHAVDLLAVEYAGTDKLLLPVYRLNQVQKFSGETAPRLDRLGGQTFAKAKKQAKKKVRLMADQLLRLFAERKTAQRAPLVIDEDEYEAFEASFPYEETPDQATAIRDVLADLTTPAVMDRLICGDVGFGKTEVALRAAFVCAHAGRQVALLCPTTVLAEQHKRTFEARFADSGIVVRGLSRFVSKKQQEKTLEELKTGQVDIVIGTHRLLSKDVHFQNLGLLIVDEEQRFGVTHKERLKELRKTIDVLTLTATPIPRTLSLAVGGMRDMSVISTPPQERRTIRTLTSRFDSQLIKSAISRELSRGGQVFYVYNRVEGIYERAALLRELLPDARIGVGHGQMSEKELEKTMLAFVRGEFDVLCATSIVESGLDIPRANTIIVDRADLFGLSQLYQIRGRVGRSSERAYCYLLVPSELRLSDDARRRIEALERFTELGSGFHVAKMDLEIRGAGEFLGADQSGFMARVGFELFLDMLSEATAELSGQEVTPEIDPELSVDVEALLPESYIEDIGLRLSLYKRYASAQDEPEVARLSEELEDRFGRLPPETQRLAEVMTLKTELRQLRALGLSATGSSATMHLRKDTPLALDQVIAQVARSQGLYSLSPDGKLKRTPRTPLADGLQHAQTMITELRSWELPAS